MKRTIATLAVLLSTAVANAEPTEKDLADRAKQLQAKLKEKPQISTDRSLYAEVHRLRAIVWSVFITIMVFAVLYDKSVQCSGRTF